MQNLPESAIPVSAQAAACQGSTEGDSVSKPNHVVVGRTQFLTCCWLAADFIQLLTIWPFA